MEYRTRLGDRASLAHNNYDCPCGCVAGLTYDRESGAEHIGRCCCGRVLWVGPDAEAVLARAIEPGHEYVLESNPVTLPWGDTQTAVLAVPMEWVRAAGAQQRVRDVVCGMTIDPATAAGTSEYRGETYYFCAIACKQRFDEEPARYADR
jgi:Cu+-exporting ATPase